MLPTLTDRRRFVVALRMMGYSRARVVQILGFQAILLGVCASAVGLLIGLLLADGTGHDPTGYLAFAFPLSTQRSIGWQTIVPTIAGGVLASCLAAVQPLLDLRAGSATGRGPRAGRVEARGHRRAREARSRPAGWR